MAGAPNVSNATPHVRRICPVVALKASKFAPGVVSWDVFSPGVPADRDGLAGVQSVLELVF
jgi:hypothetical protein